MTETLLWQTLEDCFRRSDLTGIAALADEVALTDEALAATLRWMGRNLNTMDLVEQTSLWIWDFPLDRKGNGYLWTQTAKTLQEGVRQIHKERLAQLEFFQ